MLFRSNSSDSEADEPDQDPERIMRSPVVVVGIHTHSTSRVRVLVPSMGIAPNLDGLVALGLGTSRHTWVKGGQPCRNFVAAG